jgi:hypothetical protein
MNGKVCLVLGAVLVLASGCSLTEVRNKWKGGPEYRHDGSNRTNSVRWTAETGVELEWENAMGYHYTSGVTYRRRDVDEGDGDNDNGVWVDFSFPLWRKPKKPERDIVELRKEVARLKEQVAQLAAASPGNVTQPG